MASCMVGRLGLGAFLFLEEEALEASTAGCRSSSLKKRKKKSLKASGSNLVSSYCAAERILGSAFNW